MNSRPEAWLKQAHNDLALAQLANDNSFLAQACYYASQAAEKALKGALLELGVEPPHTHVLNDLVQRLGKAGWMSAPLRRFHSGIKPHGHPIATPWMPHRPLNYSIAWMPNKRSRQHKKCSAH